MGEGRDVSMSECGDSMSCGSCLSMLMSFLGMFEGLPGMLGSSQVLLFSLLLGDTMSMRRAVV
jgi:hypothetical protein